MIRIDIINVDTATSANPYKNLKDTKVELKSKTFSYKYRIIVIKINLKIVQNKQTYINTYDRLRKTIVLSA